MEESMQSGKCTLPSGVKKSGYLDLACIVFLVGAIVFMILYSLLILPKQGGAPDSQQFAGAIVQGFALGVAKAVAIAISFIFALCFIIISVAETTIFFVLCRFEKLVYYEGKGYKKYKIGLIISAVMAGMICIAAIVYPCLFGTKALWFSLFCVLAIVCQAVSMALKVKSLRKKTEDAIAP